jgi:hypothetical protein
MLSPFAVATDVLQRRCSTLWDSFRVMEGLIRFFGELKARCPLSSPTGDWDVLLRRRSDRRLRVGRLL